MKLLNRAAFVAVTSIVVGAAGGIALAEHPSHGHGAEYSAGQPGDAKKPARIVQVTMTEANGKMLFSPSRLEVSKDEQVKFVLRNGGELEHEFVLATTAENVKHAAAMAKNPDMEHDDPNAMRLTPKKTGDLVWKFSKSGEFEFSCLIPGHREAGMIGTVVVK